MDGWMDGSINQSINRAVVVFVWLSLSAVLSLPLGRVAVSPLLTLLLRDP